MESLYVQGQNKFIGGEIILRDIKLSICGSLPKTIKEQLRDLYSTLDNPSYTPQPTKLTPNSLQVLLILVQNVRGWGSMHSSVCNFWAECRGWGSV